MADYAIGLSFHKAHRTLVRAVELTAPRRYFASRANDGFVTLPTLDPGQSYVELQAIKQSNFQIRDNDQEFRILGDDGWADSVITGSRVQASNTAYFVKDTEVQSNGVPLFRGNYDEGFALIEKCRYNKDFEIYVEFLKEMGQSQGASGDYIYDFTGFNCVLMNFNENKSAEGLTEVTFDMMSRGRPVFGRYSAGSTPLSFGGIQSGLLPINTGNRWAVVTPADNALSINVSSNIVVSYLTAASGGAAVQGLNLHSPADGAGFRLEVASTGVQVPATVILDVNDVVIQPSAALQAGTIYRLRVTDGAITQTVDGTGAYSLTGVRRPIQGLVSTFRTA
jgi:hypothetical protein